MFRLAIAAFGVGAFWMEVLRLRLARSVACRVCLALVTSPRPPLRLPEATADTAETWLG